MNIWENTKQGRLWYFATFSYFSPCKVDACSTVFSLAFKGGSLKLGLCQLWLLRQNRKNYYPVQWKVWRKKRLNLDDYRSWKCSHIWHKRIMGEIHWKIKKLEGSDCIEVGGWLNNMGDCSNHIVFHVRPS